MANLTYNSNIFTKVNKWDAEYTYLGIQVSGKFNQLNGQDFYLLDAIDIDWNGAFIEKLNTYLYSSEDLINAFNILSNEDTFIKNNYVHNSKLAQIRDELNNYISYETSQAILNIGETVMNELLARYEVLAAISDILIDRSRYLHINYNDIVKNGQVDNSRQYYLYNTDENSFDIINNEYILAHPDDEYYIFLIDDIITLNKEVKDIYNIIGDYIYDENNNSYSYTGFYNRFNIIEYNVSYLSYYLDNTAVKGEQSYYYAYNAYTTSNINKEQIGYNSQYNVYYKVEDWSDNDVKKYLLQNNNNIYIKDPENENEYISITYTGNPNYEYYIHYNKIPGTGIKKDIEDIQSQVIDNSYLLYNLSIESLNDNLKTNITPTSKNGGINRKIILDLNTSYINKDTGEISYGMISNQGIVNSFSYLFSWKILK